MARGNLRDDLHAQVERTIAAGATLRIGGKAVDRPGFYYEPTVLDHVTSEMPAFSEETFGPAAAVIRARDADEAIASPTRRSSALAPRCGRAISTRRAVTPGRSMPAPSSSTAWWHPTRGCPSVASSDSGYGRELGAYGIREFTNIKTVWIGPAKDKSKVDLSE